mmetsp:Transcript_81040/g.126356  ORF Transcript_81040/g.126356 Transcript_81040/m.126356 type:complete len:167 (+) Transcript_81040:12-512(+)
MLVGSSDLFDRILLYVRMTSYANMIVAVLAIFFLSKVAARRVQLPQDVLGTSQINSLHTKLSMPRSVELNGTSSQVNKTGSARFGVSPDLRKKRIKALGLILAAFCLLVGCATLIGTCRIRNTDSDDVDEDGSQPNPSGRRSKSIVKRMCIDFTKWLTIVFHLDDK